MTEMNTDPNGSLFPDHDSLTVADHRLTERLGAARRLMPSRDVVPDGPSGKWLRELRSMGFDQPKELAGLVEWVIEGLETGTVQVTHPGYLGLFNPARRRLPPSAPTALSLYSTPRSASIRMRRRRSRSNCT